MAGETNLDPAAGFPHFGGEHILALSLVSAACVAVPLILRRPGAAQWREPAAWFIAVSLIASELLTALYFALRGEYSLQLHLPLYLCNVASFVVAAALITRRPWLFEFGYFFGIGGTLQALLTPEVFEGLPDPVCVKFFYAHGAILLGPIVLAAVFGMRPGKWWFLRAVIWGNLFMWGVFAINVLLGANYGYFLAKPLTPSLLDYLGPWPVYLLWMQVVAAVLFWFLYLPFLIPQKTPPDDSRP